MRSHPSRHRLIDDGCSEADSDDAHQADREVNPEKYRHHIEDASNAAYLGEPTVIYQTYPKHFENRMLTHREGEADSDDADMADREANPEKYRHKIDDPSLSGSHGEAGEGDAHIEQK